MNYILKDNRITGSLETQVMGANRYATLFSKFITGISILRDLLSQFFSQFLLKCNYLPNLTVIVRVMSIPEERVQSVSQRIEEAKVKTVEVQTVFR